MRSIHIGWVFLVLISMIFVTACRQEAYEEGNEFIESLLSSMTLEEKIGQMNQYNGFWEVTGPAPQDGAALLKYEHLRKGWVGSMLNVTGVEEVRKVQEIAVKESRLGIPLLFGFDVIHGYQTGFPIPLAEAASWDLEAMELSASISAKEASAAGIHWTFAPMLDVSRDARWGRVMEGGGEDPFLASKIGAARIQGFQGSDLSNVHTIAACAKHFAGYGFSEAGRDYHSVEIGRSTLHNVVLPPFREAIKAEVKTFMNAFNTLDNIPSTANTYLLRDLLKGTWQFKGMVVSDWGSVKEIMVHGNAKDLQEASERAVIAGCDMDMESYAFVSHLAQSVREGKVSEALIDDAVRRILKLKWELGLFEDPYKYCSEEREKEVLQENLHAEAALEVALKSIVLLKNEGGILPLSKEQKRIGLIGALGMDKDSPLGSWRAKVPDSSAVSVFEGLTALSQHISYAEGAKVSLGKTSFLFPVKINEEDTSGFEEALQLARRSEYVIMVLGENCFQSGEARSRADIGLPGVQQQLLEKVYQVNPNIVLVLMNGRPLALPWAAENIPVILEAWHLGSQSGHAIAKVLFGEYNPSGKLPMSFPRSVGQLPLYYNALNTGRPEAENGTVFWSHYIDERNDPLFPFGHGMGYAPFLYENLAISKMENAEYEVTFDLSNVGNIGGAEVAQLYIRAHSSRIVRPVKELKGFKKVYLEAGEKQSLSLRLTSEELGYYDNQGAFFLDPGDFSIMIGASSQDIRLEGTLTVY
jgi:beta-glucosidase